MVDKYKKFQGVAIVQYPEQVGIYKNYFSREGIPQDSIFWVATSDPAFFFLEKERIAFSKITDFYDYNIFYKNVFNESYKNLDKALRCIDKEIFTYYPTLEKYGISFAEGSLYYLRMWCDSFETDLYEMQSLKNIISDSSKVYYVPSSKQGFFYGLYPMHINRSLEEVLGLVFEKDRLHALDSFDPKTSIVSFSKDFEEKEINDFFKNRIDTFGHIERLKKRLESLLQDLWGEKKYLAMGIDKDWMSDSGSFDFFENYIDEIQNLPSSIKVDHDKYIKNISHFFVISGINYYDCMKHIIHKTLEKFLISSFKTIDFYHNDKNKEKWTALFSIGFVSFESQSLAKLFKFYGKKVICTHHGSLAILEDKINHYLEYPYITDYIVWGEGVKNQLQTEYDFSNIRIHTLGSLSLACLKNTIEKVKEKKISKSQFKKPIIIFLLQSINDKVRVTLDHPPGIIDFINQRDLITSILDTHLDFELIIKGHPSTAGYLQSSLRFLFKKDSRVHYTSTLPLKNFLADSMYFITDRPSTSLFQAMIAGLKCYCLINSEFYTSNFIECLKEDGILFKNNQALVKALHNDLATKRKGENLETSVTIKKYCTIYNGPIEEVLSFEK